MDDSVGEGHGGLGGIRKLVAEEVDCGSAATGLRLGEVGSVAMDVKDHVGGYVAEGGRWMAGCVAEEVGDFVHGVFGRGGLGGSDGAEGD